MSSPDSPCQSTKPLEKAEDRTKTDSSFGLMRITLSCERDKIPYTMKIRGVIGMDGHTRMIHIMAKDSVWQQNEEAFEAMLMSLDQTKNTSVE